MPQTRRTTEKKANHAEKKSYGRGRGAGRSASWCWSLCWELLGAVSHGQHDGDDFPQRLLLAQKWPKDLSTVRSFSRTRASDPMPLLACGVKAVSWDMLAAFPGGGKMKPLEQKGRKTWGCWQDWNRSPVTDLKLFPVDVHLGTLWCMRQPLHAIALFSFKTRGSLWKA